MARDLHLSLYRRETGTRSEIVRYMDDLEATYLVERDPSWPIEAVRKYLAALAEEMIVEEV